MMMMGDDVVGREGGRDQADVVGGFIRSEEKRSLTAVLPTVHRESNMHMFYHMHSSHDPQALQSCLHSIERATCTCSITCTVLKIPQAEKSCFILAATVTHHKAAMTS